MTAKTATATHRVFDALQGLWPVTFANVREADPEGLLDIFEGADNTRDAYFEQTSLATKNHTAIEAGELWADYLSDFDTDHEEECDNDYGHHTDCNCKNQQYENNRYWGWQLYEAIEQRIRELND